MVRQERLEVSGHADGADTWPTTTVRDAERLVQVEVADVGAEIARPAEADLAAVTASTLKSREFN
jgi:hypothetical protein